MVQGKKWSYYLQFVIQNVFIFCLSFYTSALYMPLIALPFSNPHGVMGMTVATEYNPYNNLIRFFYLLITAPTLFFYFKWLLINKRFLTLRIIFVVVFITAFVFGQTALYQRKHANIDMFHDGEQLSVGSAMHEFHKRPYIDMFFLHGALGDPLIAKYAFTLFGESIGSFLLLNSIVEIVTYLLLFVLLLLVFKHELFFYLASIFFIGSLNLGRDIFIFFFLIISYLTVQRKIPLLAGFFVLSFTSSFSFYYTIDRAYYLLLTNLFIIAAYTVLQVLSKKRITPHALLFDLIKIFAVTLAGYAMTSIIGIFWFGLDGFKEFLQITFVEIPGWSSLMFDFQYPIFELGTVYPYWWPIIILIFEIILIIFIFLKTSYNPQHVFFPLILLFFAVIAYKSALGRSDLYHILYIVHFVFLSFFILLQYITRYVVTDYFQKVMIYLFVSSVFLLPYFITKKLINVPTYSYNHIKIYLLTPYISDDFWLTEEQNQVTRYIVNNTQRSDFIFDMTNEALYYYLTRRQNPTRFYMIWFASATKYQDEALKDLQSNPPKYIIYKSTSWPNNIDSIPNHKRVPKIDQWVKNNYIHDKRIVGTTILRQKNN